MKYEHEYMTWETRPDGVYLTVFKQAKSKVGVQQLQEELDEELVMNYDWPRISEVFMSARGKPDFVGPAFKVFDKEKEDYINFNIKKLRILMNINSGIETLDTPLSVADIEYLLKKEKVTHGVDWSEVSGIISSKKYGENLEIAKATLPEHGKDSQIQEKVSVDQDSKPIILNSGKADFKNIKNVTQIEAGEIIAVRTKPTKGTPGKNIWGDEIPANDGNQIQIKTGNNTELTDDGNTLKAAKSGYLYRSNGAIHVGELLTVPNNVDYQSGNINYSGDVVIFGNVVSGFSVQALGNIHVEGNVEAAEVISKKGDVVIDGGVFGKSKAVIKAGKDIRLTRIQDTQIVCSGDLFIENSIRNCTTRSQKIFLEKGCEIHGANITAFETINLYDIGGDEVENNLWIKDRETELKRQKLKEMDQTQEKIDHALEALEKRMKAMSKMLQRNDGKATQKEKQEMAQVIQQREATKKKSEFIKKQKDKLESEIVEPKEKIGKIVVHGNIFPATVIHLYEQLWDRDKTLNRMEFQWSPEELKIRPIPSKNEESPPDETPG